MSSVRGVNVGGNLFDVTDTSNIAPFNSGSFATRDYAKDRFFIMTDGLLYRATVDITSGDPLVINGNIKRTTIDEVIRTIETDSDLIAPTEDGETSSSDYVVGEQIVRSGLLYKVISAIAEGDTFVVDNNIELSGSITEQFNNMVSWEQQNILGAKNLLPNNAVTQTVNGITYTINSDGTVTVNGTATANSYIYLLGNSNNTKTFDFPVIGTGCPSDNPNGALRIGFASGYVDIGEGVNIPSNTPVSPFVFVTNGATVNNLVFKPMIRPASIKDDTYVPYAKTNRELTEQITSIGTILEASGSVHPTVSSSYFDICSLTLPKGTWAITCWSYTNFSGNMPYTNGLNYNNKNYVVRGNTVDGGGNINTAYVKFEAPTVVTAKGYSTSEFATSSSREQGSRIQAIRIA